MSWLRITPASASDGSRRRQAARASSTSSGASSHRPTNGTPAAAAARSMASRSAWRAKTASAITSRPGRLCAGSIKSGVHPEGSVVFHLGTGKIPRCARTWKQRPTPAARCPRRVSNSGAIARHGPHHGAQSPRRREPRRRRSRHRRTRWTPRRDVTAPPPSCDTCRSAPGARECGRSAD